MKDLLNEQNELLEKWEAGDRSDQLVERLCQLQVDLIGKGFVSYTEERNAQIIEVLEEGSQRKFLRKNS
jgi:hypothetical protein